MNSPEGVTHRYARRWWVVTVALLFLVAALGGAWYGFGRGKHPAASADEAMAARAQQVMPFDLNRTSHTFVKTADGGTQTVMVNDPTDTSDLTLIRSHLSTEAKQFLKGDYADPAKIHGVNMPGVRELEAGADRVKVVFAQLPRGAQITYSSVEPSLVLALHAWFDRQTTDHGMPGMGG